RCATGTGYLIRPVTEASDSGAPSGRYAKSGWMPFARSFRLARDGRPGGHHDIDGVRPVIGACRPQLPAQPSLGSRVVCRAMMGRRDALMMIAAVALLSMVTIGWGERIGVNGGAGWDGQAYVSWARDFPGAMRSGFTVYQSKRVVPSAIVYG